MKTIENPPKISDCKKTSKFIFSRYFGEKNEFFLLNQVWIMKLMIQTWLVRWRHQSVMMGIIFCETMITLLEIWILSIKTWRTGICKLFLSPRHYMFQTHTPLLSISSGKMDIFYWSLWHVRKQEDHIQQSKVCIVPISNLIFSNFINIMLK